MGRDAEKQHIRLLLTADGSFSVCDMNAIQPGANWTLYFRMDCSTTSIGPGIS